MDCCSQRIDADKIEISYLVYGGRACNKLGVIYNDKNYLLKFPGNLKNKNLKNVVLSYSNSPVCEYIGSHIFQMLGIKAHQTLLPGFSDLRDEVPINA